MDKDMKKRLEDNMNIASAEYAVAVGEWNKLYGARAGNDILVLPPTDDLKQAQAAIRRMGDAHNAWFIAVAEYAEFMEDDAVD